jgi:hypothetical protein
MFRAPADQGRMKMRKTILTIAGSALIALSTVQFAAAASGHHGKTYHRASTQFRNSNAYVAPSYVPAEPEWSGYGYYGYGGGASAPAGRY